MKTESGGGLPPFARVLAMLVTLAAIWASFGLFAYCLVRVCQ